MNLEEKEQNCGDFIKSDCFTEATYGVIMVVRQNILRMINLVELYGILLNRIEVGDFRHNFPDEELARIKQLILVDALSKVMIIVESLFVLFDSFSRFSYREIPSILVRYAQSKIDGFIESFHNGKVNVWKICGFPKVACIKHNCGLTRDETKFIYDVLTNSCEAIKNTIENIIGFYESNRILYGKFKHGLLFWSGLRLDSTANHIPASIFLVFDKLKEKPSKICFQGKDVSLLGLEWFNVYSILPYWELTFTRYSQILGEIERLSTYVLNNNLLRAFNCGQDYLPMKIMPNGEARVEIYLTNNLTEEEQRKFNGISQRVASNTYCPEPKFNVVFNFSDEKIMKLLSCFIDNQSATIWKTPN